MYGYMVNDNKVLNHPYKYSAKTSAKMLKEIDICF